MHGKHDMKRIINFVQLYLLYRRHHSRGYAFERARDIAFRSIPF